MKVLPTTAAAVTGNVRAPVLPPRTAFRALVMGAFGAVPAPQHGGPRRESVPTPGLGISHPQKEQVAAREEPEGRKRDDDASLELDPAVRHAAQLAPPMATASEGAREADVAQVARRASLEELVPQLVRRIAWGGDARRGSVRMELGAGELAGATLVVHADGGRVRVELTVPSGADAEAWRDRIERRLAARGLDVAAVDVR